MNNSNLYEKLKSREKTQSLNKTETKVTVPQFAKYLFIVKHSLQTDD